MENDVDPTINQLVERLCQELEWALTTVKRLSPEPMDRKRADYSMSIVRILRKRLMH